MILSYGKSWHRGPKGQAEGDDGVEEITNETYVIGFCLRRYLTRVFRAGIIPNGGVLELRLNIPQLGRGFAAGDHILCPGMVLCHVFTHGGHSRDPFCDSSFLFLVFIFY